MELNGLEAALYLRKSRAEDGQDTETTLQRHKATLTEYAAAHGIHIVETYAEVVSGGSLYARPQMLRLLEDVEAGRYQAVLCMDMDRLSRGSMRDQGIILDALKYAGVLIVTPDKVYDLSDEADEQFAEIKTFLSRQEYRMIIKRMQRGKMRSVKNGCYITKAPFGYRNVHSGKLSTLEVYEPEAKFVRMIFGMAVAGTGGTTIARTINSAGMRTRQGNEFDRLAINRILHNPVYIGKVPYNRQISVKERGEIHYHRQPKEKWTIIDGLHPAIIDVETFEAAQEVLASRHSGPHFDGTIQNPLAGIVRCRNCGGRMQRLISRNKVKYLFCQKSGCCAMTPIEVVENAVLAHLSEILAGIELQPEEQVGSVEQAKQAALEAVRGKLTSAEKTKARLYELVEANVYSAVEFKERMDALKEKISRLQKQEAETVKALESARNADPIKQAERIRDVLDLYQEQDGAGRNALLKSVVDVIWYEKKKGSAKADFILEVVLKGT